MADKKLKRLSKIAKELNVGIGTIVDFLNKKGWDLNSNPNNKVDSNAYDMLLKEFGAQKNLKEESRKRIMNQNRSEKQAISVDDLDKAPEGEQEADEDEPENEDVLIISDSSAGTSTPKPGARDTEKKDTQPPSEPKKETSTEAQPPVENKQGPTQKPQEQEKEETQEKGPAASTTSDLQSDKQDFKVVGKIDLKETETQKASTRKKQPGKPGKPKKDMKEKAGEKPQGANPGKEEKQQPPVPERKQQKPADAEKTPKADQAPTAKAQGPKEEKRQEPKKADKPAAEEQSKNQGKPEKPQPEKKKAQKPQPEKPQPEKDEAQKPQHEKPQPEKDEAQKPQEKAPPGPKPESEENQKKDEAPEGDDIYRTKVKKLSGPTVVGKIDLPASGDAKKKKQGENERKRPRRKKRKRIQKDQQKPQQKPQQDNTKQQQGKGEGQKQRQNRPKPQQNRNAQSSPKPRRKKVVKKVFDEEEVQKQVKETLARLEAKNKKPDKSAKRKKREKLNKRKQEEEARHEVEKNVLKVTEFVTVNELAQMLDVSPTEVISKCMDLGMFVNINQRLEAEPISIIADEYGYEVEFVSADEEDEQEEEEVIDETKATSRPPIVTVMGHVDHGKTSLLDHIRKSNIIAGEAGGITQHVGAYLVSLDDDRSITFIDTPGHQAFTSMRARGAKMTDIAIIVIAADDDIMPQTREAINHASAAGVPIVFAINKIDKNNASPEKIKEKLANMNYLVEEWGGKYLSADISAKNGTNVEDLLELVVLQSEILELKADYHTPATGSVIEAALDKGRGYVASLLVQQGTLKLGDFVLAGSYSGRVKAMFNERGQNIDEAIPSSPVEILGLNGSPQPGEKFKVMGNEKEAREIATKRHQLQREQSLRLQKPMTLDEIGRRIAIGNFQEVNVIIKGDVDGSIEALSDSLMKLSNEEVQVKIIHKGVGEISESDVMLATASQGVIIGFNVRPSLGARKMAEQNGIDIRLYSIIYDAIGEMKDALEGLLEPEIKEEIEGTAEVRETFKISKVGTIAGCMVKEGKINRNSRVRVIRDGIVIYTGTLGSLKRFKKDEREVASGYECGLNVDRFNDVKEGDIIEAFKEREVKRKLE